MITTSNIRSMMMPLFEYWIKTVGGGQGPQHIYYFRDGVSEGQYEHVLQQEVHDMRKCITEKYPGAKVRLLSSFESNSPLIVVEVLFTVVVASKRHHLRFFPKEGDFQAGDKNGNSLPGTIVEHDITHPFEYDFCEYHCLTCSERVADIE